MALGFAADCRMDGGNQGRVTTRIITQGRTQVHVALLTQTGVNLANAGDPHAVAALAEIMAKRLDQPDFLTGFIDPDIVRRTTCAFG